MLLYFDVERSASAQNIDWDRLSSPSLGGMQLQIKVMISFSLIC
jgi:hypothetical protein